MEPGLEYRNLTIQELIHGDRLKTFTRVEVLGVPSGIGEGYQPHQAVLPEGKEPSDIAFDLVDGLNDGGIRVVLSEAESDLESLANGKRVLESCVKNGVGTFRLHAAEEGSFDSWMQDSPPRLYVVDSIESGSDSYQRKVKIGY